MHALNVQPELRGQITDMEANAEDKGEVAFDLGASSLTIERFIKGHIKRTISNNQLKIDYYFFQSLASKLDIDLPDQPPEETAQFEMEKFLQNQTNHLVECLCKHKSQYIREMYAAGQCVEWLTVCIVESKEHANKVAAMQCLQSCIKNLERTAKQLNIDISEELSKVKTPEQLEGEELTELKKQLKKKLCKAKQVEPKRSEIDPTRIITNEYWAVSLVRLPDKNKEHAFLVLEGKTVNMSMIWFADFVANDPFDLLRPGIRDGKVRMDYHDDEVVAGLSSELLFRCNRDMMEIRNGDRLLYSTWPIPKPTAEKLVQSIQAQEKISPKYNVVGNSVLAACSATSSSNPTGHNCFTFARMMLRNLHDKYIEVPDDKLGRWIYSATSRFLVDRQLNNQRLHTLQFGLFTFMAGAVIAYLFVQLY